MALTLHHKGRATTCDLKTAFGHVCLLKTGKYNTQTKDAVSQGGILTNKSISTKINVDIAQQCFWEVVQGSCCYCNVFLIYKRFQSPSRH